MGAVCALLVGAVLRNDLSAVSRNGRRHECRRGTLHEARATVVLARICGILAVVVLCMVHVEQASGNVRGGMKCCFVILALLAGAQSPPTII